MAAATPKQALNHPNWSMGQKVTIDSATLMNKALELLEAHHLFSVEADRLQVLIHPQSIVHCLVLYRDGSVLAQMSCPDMRTPIAYSLAWPERMQAPTARLDLAEHRHAHLRSARRSEVSGASPGARRADRRRDRQHRFQCRQRGRGRGLSRRPIGLPRHRRSGRGDPGSRRRPRRPRPPTMSRKCSPSMTRRGPWRARFCSGLHNRIGRAKNRPSSGIPLPHGHDPPAFEHRRHCALLPPAFLVRAHRRGLLPRARPFPRGPLVRGRGQDLLDRLRS